MKIHLLVGGFLAAILVTPAVAWSTMADDKSRAHQASSSSNNNNNNNKASSSTSDKVIPFTRRQLLVQCLGAGVATTTTSLVANAFDNKISTQYDDRPKRRGPQPKDLGVSLRTTTEGYEYTGLKTCGFQPNCFNSYLISDEDPEHSIPAWVWPSDKFKTPQDAMQDLYQVLLQYQPGQNGIDGGGFSIQTNTPNYIYVQYEALTDGYLDDVEFALDDDGLVHVRSSSRIGIFDNGVNAKRLNYIAERLRERGWDAVGVDYKKHPNYVYENHL